jgi:glutamine amidotransferase
VRIVVCDVGLGNLRSVERGLLEACKQAGCRAQVEVTKDVARLAEADRLVMPGQGGFGDCARAISGGVGDAIRNHLATQRPYLGICLGLQVLFEGSEEAPGCAGLGVLKGEVVKLRDGIDTVTGAPLKIPHTGWNTAQPTLNRGLLAERAEHFYFVHSFVVAPRDAAVVAATTDYGEPFVSAIAYDNVFACQFHPEKSQRAGLALLERFLAS